jgi:hypothetical protein
LSIDLITEVRRRLDVSGGELLVAIELADASNDKGDGIFVGVARIADRSRQDPRTVQRQLKHLVEVGWLEVVRRGGGRLPDGTGIPTTYRISPAWVKGDSLPGLPDFQARHYHRDKDDNLSPLPEELPRQNGGATVTKQGGYGDTAVSGDPLTRIPKDARARAIPSGSRSAGDDAKPYDVAARSEHWRRMAVTWVVGECNGLAITTLARQWSDLPTEVRLVLPPKIEHTVSKAIDREREQLPLSEATIRAELQQFLTEELRQFKPSTPADRAAAHAA